MCLGPQFSNPDFPDQTASSGLQRNLNQHLSSVALPCGLLGAWCGMSPWTDSWDGQRSPPAEAATGWASWGVGVGVGRSGGKPEGLGWQKGLIPHSFPE